VESFKKTSGPRIDVYLFYFRACLDLTVPLSIPNVAHPPNLTVVCLVAQGSGADVSSF
jgi:hypothetical protein